MVPSRLKPPAGMGSGHLAMALRRCLLSLSQKLKAPSLPVVTKVPYCGWKLVEFTAYTSLLSRWHLNVKFLACQAQNSHALTILLPCCSTTPELPCQHGLSRGVQLSCWPPASAIRELWLSPAAHPPHGAPLLGPLWSPPDSLSCLGSR